MATDLNALYQQIDNLKVELDGVRGEAAYCSHWLVKAEVALEKIVAVESPWLGHCPDCFERFKQIARDGLGRHSDQDSCSPGELK